MRGSARGVDGAVNEVFKKASASKQNVEASGWGTTATLAQEKFSNVMGRNNRG
jgi:hypothetical protein